MLSNRMLAQAASLDALMQEIRNGKKVGPSDPNYDGRDPEATAWASYQRWTQSSGPGGAREGLLPTAGPQEINFDKASCDISQKDKDAIWMSVACGDIGAAQLAHEQHHRVVCLQGRDKYEALNAAEVAREEAEAYAIEAETLRLGITNVVARRGALVYESNESLTGGQVKNSTKTFRGKTTAVGSSIAAGSRGTSTALTYSPGAEQGTLITFPATLRATHRISYGNCTVPEYSFDVRANFYLLITGSGARFHADWPAGQVDMRYRGTCGGLSGNASHPSPSGFVSLIKELELKDGAVVTEPAEPPPPFRGSLTRKVTLSCTAR